MIPFGRRSWLLAASLAGMTSASLTPTGAGADDAVERRAQEFISQHEQTIRPLEIEVGRRWWQANTTGKEEDFAAKQTVETKLDLALADKPRFAQLKAIRQAGPTSPALARQIELLYRQYLAKQVDPRLLERMIAKSNDIEKAFNVARAQVDGQAMSDSQVRSVLKQSDDGARRRQVWEASKEVGKAVESNLLELVALRNEAARTLEFRDFHQMQLYLAEQDQAQVVKLFDDLDDLTRAGFLRVKEELDAALAAQCQTAVDQLRPWHYHDPFFQEVPAVFGGDLDAVYKSADIVKLCRDFYAGIDLPIDDVIERSDLYEKPGKSPHAFCIDVDREGDVRVLANIVANEQWMGTMLHELGHAVYSSKNIPRGLPYVLRGEAHILSTEGVAMMFERFSKNADWLTAMGVSVADPKKFNQVGDKMRRSRLLIFSRWCQVMLRFEKAMYADPSQDLNRLWWDLVEKYQGLTRPEGRNAPDYASKIHVVSAPAYYHNYMLGELFACQVHAAICRDVLNGADPNTAHYTGNRQVGRFMRDKVFGPGRTLDWNELTRHATGADLGPAAFAEEFAGN